jgi:hypothetical protein
MTDLAQELYDTYGMKFREVFYLLNLWALNCTRYTPRQVAIREAVEFEINRRINKEQNVLQ